MGVGLIRTGHRLAAFTTCAVLLVLPGVVVVGAARPEVPREWDGLRRGMTREEVAAGFRDYAGPSGMRGRDLLSRKGEMLGSECWWDLDLDFDAGGRLERARLSFTHCDCGLLDIERSFPLQ